MKFVADVSLDAPVIIAIRFELFTRL